MYLNEIEFTVVIKVKKGLKLVLSTAGSYYL